MLSWNDRPIPFTGKDDLEKCVAENECSFWVCHSFVILRHHLCILYIYIYIYILIFLFSCAVVGPKKRICWLSSTSWHPWNMQLVVLPFHFKGSSVLKYSIVFSYSLEDAPTPNQDIFFYEPILERLRDSSRDSNGTVNSHQWGTSLGSKLNHSEIDSQRNSKEDS